eukprot:6247168-Prorocentrum_lima.AAC.1
MVVVVVVALTDNTTNLFQGESRRSYLKSVQKHFSLMVSAAAQLGLPRINKLIQDAIVAQQHGEYEEEEGGGCDARRCRQLQIASNATKS